MTLWQRAVVPLAIAAAIFNPLTFFVWPIFGTGAVFLGVSLWTLLLGVFVAYPISTFIGGLPPIERPRDLFSLHSWIATPLMERQFARERIAIPFFEQEAAREDAFDAAARSVLDDNFEEVWERYHWKASQTEPVEPDVHAALTALRSWLGKDLTESFKNGLYTPWRARLPLA